MAKRTLFDVVKEIALRLKENQHIHAMWLEGSYATEKFTENSDIDVWLDIDNGMFDECIDIVRKELQKVGKIDAEEARGIYSQNPKLAKHIFHLKGFPKAQTIELDLQEHSREFTFSRKEHIIKILFDKDETIQWQP
ncbi:MAG: nucleotidyltransferase domain-containing protein [Candidatus Spechtbacterales bacterium]